MIRYIESVPVLNNHITVNYLHEYDSNGVQIRY